MASVIIDNVDPSIVYSGTWTVHGRMSLTRTIGNSATINFVGNSIAVYGGLGPYPADTPAVTSYQIDGGSPTIYAPASPSAQVAQLLFYQSPTLPYGSHQLVMTNMVELDWIWLDYFQVTQIDSPPQQPVTTAAVSSSTRQPVATTTQFTPAPGASSSSGTSTSRSNISTSNASTSTPSLISTASPSTTDQSQSFSPKTIPSDSPTFLASVGDYQSSNLPSTGIIVGGIIGGILALALCLLVVLLLLRKRRKNQTAHVDSMSNLNKVNDGHSSIGTLSDSPRRDMSFRDDASYPHSSISSTPLSSSALETGCSTRAQGARGTEGVLPPSKVEQAWAERNAQILSNPALPAYTP